MADLIDRDALEPFYESGTDPTDPYADMTFIRAEHIENAPAVNRWIPCSERLPETGTDVIVYYPFWQESPIQIAHRQDDCYLWETSDGEYNLKDVTHWMPLPEPPKEVENENR